MRLAPTPACGGVAKRGRGWRAGLGCLLAAGLAGCAATGTMQLAHWRARAPIRIVLVQAPIKIDRARLRAVFAPAADAKSPLAADAIAQGLRQAGDYALAAMQSALRAHGGRVVLVAPAPGMKVPLEPVQGKSIAAGMSQSEADRIEAATGADAILRFRITDYGLTPKSWRDGYIAFEVGSTLGLAAAIAYSGTAVAKTAAGAYLAQETVEETAEAYAGFSALDKVSRPVRIEAELIRLHPLATLWTASDTGLSDTRWSRLFGKVGAHERERQLEQATDHAVRKLVSGFAHAVGDVARRAAGGKASAPRAAVS